MGHPSGGHGNAFQTKHDFEKALVYVGSNGVDFKSTTGEKIHATQSFARDGITPTITFTGKKSRHGNVCADCWGFRQNCSGTWIGQCVESLDMSIP
jgi:hypothetical protein